MSQTDQESSGKLAEDVIQTVSARESDGVTIPADALRQLGIEKGGQITIRGEAGDREVSVGKASELL